jgi:choline dehydrogenase-like flavoprotein
MSFLNIDSIKERTYDVIVVGSGMSGGWAAKEFTEKGLKTLMLERGRSLEHITDYPTTLMQPWEFEHKGSVPKQVIEDNPIVSKCYAFTEDTMHMFTKDAEQPYIQAKPFDWIRGYHVGGKSIMWARATQRWSQFDFDGPARDGFSVEWPIGYKDIAPWYAYVERFIGVSGNKDGLAQLPDGVFLPPHEQTCVEKHFSQKMAEHYKGSRPSVIGRCAHLTKPQPIHLKQGRGKCQHRDLCTRGCPFGGYFSSVSSTIPWSMKTGKLTLKADSVVHSVIYDEKAKKAVGVRVIDAHTKEMTEYYARVIFLNASTIATNMILLNSTSNRFQNGLGNENGLLGKYVSFHNFKANISGEYEGFLENTTAGIRPNASYIPRFRNMFKQDNLNFQRGWAAGFATNRIESQNSDGLGIDLKNNLKNKNYGNWSASSWMMGETLPKITNFVELDKNLKDQFGIPQVRISVDYDDNDRNMTKDFMTQMEEMMTVAGFKNIRATESTGANPGLDIHELGGAIMGKDPKTSVTNKWNQLHQCKNVFITDGACFSSTGTQNPSLTFMAITARAANYAIAEFKKGIL